MDVGVGVGHLRGYNQADVVRRTWLRGRGGVKQEPELRPRLQLHLAGTVLIIHLVLVPVLSFRCPACASNSTCSICLTLPALAGSTGTRLRRKKI